MPAKLAGWSLQSQVEFDPKSRTSSYEGLSEAERDKTVPPPSLPPALLLRVSVSPLVQVFMRGTMVQRWVQPSSSSKSYVYHGV